MAVAKHSRTCAKVAFSYLKNVSEAEDITQEVFLTLFESSKKFEDDEHLKAWLIRVTINKCKNHLKSSWFKNRNELPEDLAYMPKEESELLQAVLSLSSKYRIPIHLYYYEGYSIKEISEILEEPMATVGTRLARGRKKLKNLIGGDDYEQGVIQIIR
ncbi:MAG: RNA polymerase sigma factor [Romboutsia sp.]